MPDSRGWLFLLKPESPADTTRFKDVEFHTGKLEGMNFRTWVRVKMNLEIEAHGWNLAVRSPGICELHGTELIQEEDMRTRDPFICPECWKEALPVQLGLTRYWEKIELARAIEIEKKERTLDHERQIRIRTDRQEADAAAELVL